MSSAADLATLDALIEELTVDAYGDEEELVGFLTGAEDALKVGEIATVAGAEIRNRRCRLRAGRTPRLARGLRARSPALRGVAR